jgi:Uncharacterized protein conserved in bacteria (DUF2334)
VRDGKAPPLHVAGPKSLSHDIILGKSAVILVNHGWAFCASQRWDMVAHFVLRLDDACPTMARAPWARIDAACEQLAVWLIVGVIQDCRDPGLRFDAPDPHYWNHVRRWREKGWTIAMHGLHHACHGDPPGCRALVPFHRGGEFVGLPLTGK